MGMIFGEPAAGGVAVPDEASGTAEMDRESFGDAGSVGGAAALD